MRITKNLTWRKNSFPSARVFPGCDPESKLDIELNWLQNIEEDTEDLSSKKPLAAENDTECPLGDAGLGVLDGDTDTDRLVGEPGCVDRGVMLVWDSSNRLCDTRGLAASFSESLSLGLPVPNNWLRIGAVLLGSGKESSAEIFQET